MGTINMDDAIAFRLRNGEIICSECMTQDGLEMVDSPDDVFFDKDAFDENAVVFCDRCNTKLSY